MASTVAAAKTQSVDALRKTAGAPGQAARPYKLDTELTRRSNDRSHGPSLTRVIVTLLPGAQLPPEFKKYSRNTSLDLINGEVLDLPNNVLARMAAHPSVFRVHYDRPIASHNYRTSVTVGARTVQESLGYTGAGIGVAVIDSGITTWHDDLTNNTSKLYGISTELTYRLEVDEPGHIVLKGTNKTATSTDDITLNEAGPTSTEITYHANIEFNGLAKLADPLAGIAFERVGKETEEQMTAALQK